MTNTLKFGLAESLHTLRESASYSNQQLRYAIEQISKKYAQGYKEHHLVESFVSSMQPYLWSEDVAAAVLPVSKSLEKQAGRLTALHLYEALTAYDRMGFMTDATSALISFVNENTTSAELISALSKFGFDSRVKSFCDNLAMNESRNMDVQHSTSTCEVSDVYCPVYENDGNTFFNVKGVFFGKDDKGLRKLDKAGIESLPVKFKTASSLFNSRDIKIVEGRILYRIGKDKYEFTVESNNINATLNGKAVKIDSLEHLAEFSAKNIFEGRGTQRMNEIETIRDWATRIVKVDGVKVLESKVYRGLTSTVFNVDGQLYLHSVNEGMNTELFGKTSATAAINKIRKELRFDISKSFGSMLIGESKRISDLSITSSKISDNIKTLEDKIKGVSKLNESTEVDAAMTALTDALRNERAQYNQVNREITKIETSLDEELEASAEEPGFEPNTDKDAIKVGDMVKTQDGKTGKVTGFSESGEATVILDGGEVINPLVSNLTKCEDELNAAIDANNTMEESEHLDGEEDMSNGVVYENPESEIVDSPEQDVEVEHKEDSDCVEATLVISFGPYSAMSSIEVSADAYHTAGDNENVTIKNPLDGIDLVPKKYLKVAQEGGMHPVEPVAIMDLDDDTEGGEEMEGTEEVEEANKGEYSDAHAELGGKIGFKVNTMGKIEGTHNMKSFNDFLDKHVADKKITNKTQYVDREEEHEVYGDPKFFVIINGEIEEAFAHEKDALSLVAQLQDIANGKDQIDIVPRGEMDDQEVNDFLLSREEEHVEESENHVDNSDLTLHQVIGMVMGDDHGLTEDELLAEFSAEDVQKMKDFVRNHQALIKRLDGIPYDGESEEWDSIQEPGKDLLGKLLDKWEEDHEQEQPEEKDVKDDDQHQQEIQAEMRD